MMGKWLKIMLVLLILGLVSLACDRGVEKANESTDSDMAQEVATVVAATISSAESSQPVDEGADAQKEDTDDTDVEDTTEEEVITPAADNLQVAPVAIVVDQEELAKDGTLVLSFVNPDGQPITAYKVPGIMFAYQQQIHIAGTMPGGQIMTPLIYYSNENGGVLRQSVNDNITDLGNVARLHTLVGAPAQPVVAYSTADLTGNGAHTELFVSKLQDIGSATPLLVDDNSQSLAYKPLALDVAGGEPTGVWFTREPYGIGGADLIFRLHRGLYYYNIDTKQIVEYFNDTRSPMDVSSDRQLGAYRFAEANQNKSLTVNVLMTASVNTTFPLSPNHDRGAGFALFSQDGSRVAWMECGGSMMDSSLHCNLKAGDMNGTILYDSAISSAIGGGPVYHVQPVGWLDGDTVLAQVRRWDKDKAELIKINIIDGKITTICDGKFIGLVYP